MFSFLIRLHSEAGQPGLTQTLTYVLKKVLNQTNLVSNLYVNVRRSPN